MLSSLTPLLNTITSLSNLLQWPDLNAGELRALAVLSVFWLLFALEARFAYRQHTARTVRQSYFTNLGAFILNDTLMSLLSVSSLWLIAERFAPIGLLSGIESPVVKAIVSFLLLDLVLYVWHRANHRFDALWMFHKVHHSDRCMNVSTAFRLHGIEVFLTSVVKAAFIVLMGVDAAVVLANEAVVTLFVMFHHTNVAFRGEHGLGRLTVVPSLHRVHHSSERTEHDHNYGAVFSVWDRLFGTLAELEPKELGLENVPGHSLLDLVRFGVMPPKASQPPTLQTMIAEAAYYRAEKRGFVPGYDQIDWLEAEKEILARRSAPPTQLKAKPHWPWKTFNPFALWRKVGTASPC